MLFTRPGEVHCLGPREKVNRVAQELEEEGHTQWVQNKKKELVLYGFGIEVWKNFSEFQK